MGVYMIEHLRKLLNHWKALLTVYCRRYIAIGWGSTDGFDTEDFRRRIDFCTRVKRLRRETRAERPRPYGEFLAEVAADNAV